MSWKFLSHYDGTLDDAAGFVGTVRGQTGYDHLDLERELDKLPLEKAKKASNLLRQAWDLIDMANVILNEEDD